MPRLSKNLNLIIPSLSDEIHQTILDIGRNFEKLDDISEIYMSEPPTEGMWSRDRKIYKMNAEIGDYIGWINVREGRAAPQWEQLKFYNVEDVIVPTRDNGHYYVCVQSGWSGVNEPTFPTTSNQPVSDIKGATTWKPSTHYELYDIVLPSNDNNRFYVCTVPGVSGQTEPVWSLVDGSTVDDGMVVWTSYRIAIWQEAGAAALFRPFGKIE